MLYFLLLLLFQLQGICGTWPYEDFRFCADRNQTQKGHIRYEFQKDNISIINHANELTIRAPFPDSQMFGLPDPLGPYRFCLCWHHSTKIFRLHYGKHNYNLSTKAADFLCTSDVRPETNPGDASVLQYVSYAVDNGTANKSLPNAGSYNFIFQDSGTEDQKGSIQVCDVERAIRTLDMDVTDSRKGRKHKPLYRSLQILQSRLGEVVFKGAKKTFGTGTATQATIWKITPQMTSQDLSSRAQWEKDKQVHGFDMTLPKIVFEKLQPHSKSAEERVILLDINSQTFFQSQNSCQILGEKVIGISVGSRPVYGLPRDQRVVLTFWHNLLPENMTPQCVFWKEGLNASPLGFWSTSGCEAETGKNQTTCRCNHLTFFAVLMASSPDIDSIHKEYLTVVTYAGCIVSAVAALFTVCFFLCSRKNQRDHIVYIHMNLLCAIFLLDVSFLASALLASASSRAACQASAMFLHFGLLACIAWMGIEGYSLFRLVIEVFNSHMGHILLRLAVVGWGFPIFIVAVIFLTNQANYGPLSIKVSESSHRYTNSTICWLTEQKISSILNMGLLSLVLLFNSIMLAAMVREICKLRERERHWKYAVMLLGLSCVLGIPWALIFFSFISGTVKLVALYLFTILNSLQGFFIFLWNLAKILQTRKASSSPERTYSNSFRLQSSDTNL